MRKRLGAPRAAVAWVALFLGCALSGTAADTLDELSESDLSLRLAAVVPLSVLPSSKKRFLRGPLFTKTPPNSGFDFSKTFEKFGIGSKEGPQIPEVKLPTEELGKVIPGAGGKLRGAESPRDPFSGLLDTVIGVSTVCEGVEILNVGTDIEPTFTTFALVNVTVSNEGPVAFESFTIESTRDIDFDCPDRDLAPGRSVGAWMAAGVGAMTFCTGNFTPTMEEMESGTFFLSVTAAPIFSSEIQPCCEVPPPKDKKDKSPFDFEFGDLIDLKTDSLKDLTDTSTGAFNLDGFKTLVADGAKLPGEQRRRLFALGLDELKTIPTINDLLPPGVAAPAGTLTGQSVNLGTGKKSNGDDNTAVCETSGVFRGICDPVTAVGGANCTVTAIDVEKLTNGEQADEVGEAVQIIIGGEAVFTYIVTNPGNTPLFNVTLVDDIEGEIDNLISGDVNNDGVLDLDETWIYSASRTVTGGLYSNVATVTGTTFFG
eukprot:Cvel_30909.t1-p1 / transcript=Cvel_30909.t1 / gene=Cvel_30909 / organism=Chromera_velia_CCMP2878 / gene_product=hypothetical protein / transcript_product=hypothetical protein / location=Cvel_scaffold4497:1-6517(-) / protein_length=485 / sequence_SO=supercontig / SO=protein_coding / is_pseudo=false